MALSSRRQTGGINRPHPSSDLPDEKVPETLKWGRGNRANGDSKTLFIERHVLISEMFKDGEEGVLKWIKPNIKDLGVLFSR